MRKVLSYPGSKWNIVGQLVELIPTHHSYVEPYFGSGAMLFSKQLSDIETVNDLDSDITNLFKCIQQDSERLARLVMTTPFSREEYDNQYDSHLSGDASRYQKAVGFLIKCWQGYGFRTNNYKVGWKNDVIGREKAYALWNWYRLPEWIIEIAERLKKVQIENRPALEVIQRFNYPDVFQYLDPPYLLKTRYGKQYKYEMSDADHEKLLKIIVHSKAKIMISGYDSDMYSEYLKDWNRMELEAYAEKGSKRIEVIWMNYEIEKQFTIFDY